MLVIFAVHSIAAGAQQSFSQLLRDGLQLLRAGNYAGALEKFEAAAEIRRDAGNAWLVRGAAENRLGRYADAFSSPPNDGPAKHVQSPRRMSPP